MDGGRREDAYAEGIFKMKTRQPDSHFQLRVHPHVLNCLDISLFALSATGRECASSVPHECTIMPSNNLQFTLRSGLTMGSLFTGASIVHYLLKPDLVGREAPSTHKCGLLALHVCQS